MHRPAFGAQRLRRNPVASSFDAARCGFGTEIVQNPHDCKGNYTFLTSSRRAANTVRVFLNHSGGDIMDHYIRNSALGELQLAEQETISAHLVKALGRPRGLV